MNRVHGMSVDQSWGTPASVFDPLHAEFGFTVDAAALPSNAKCARFFTPEQDGLAQDWAGERVFCNPPYGKGIAPWVAKLASRAAQVGVGLLPARTDTRWFHDHILNIADDIRFIKGRIKFVGASYNAPFPCMVVVWRN